MASLSNELCHMLGLDPENVPDETKSMLLYFLEIAEKRIRGKACLASTESIPDELSYIPTEYAVLRYNRIGSEGYRSHSVEGESITFEEDDFAGFEDAINDWLAAQEGPGKKGKVRFI